MQFARIGGSNAVTDLSDPGGAPGLSPRVVAGVSRLNLFGLGQIDHSAGRGYPRCRSARCSIISCRKIFNRPKFDATFSVLYDDTLRRAGHSSRNGKRRRCKLTQHVSKPITIFYGFTYRHVGVSDLKIDPLLVPQLAQSVRVGIASVNLDPGPAGRSARSAQGNLQHDRRGCGDEGFRFADQLRAHSGAQCDLLSAGVETGSGAGNAGRLAAGIRRSRRQLRSRAIPIPLAERFFAGGGNTQRGFPENQAGPRDTLTGFPLGGSAMFFNNTELRFPLYGANINGVLFEDAGNVYSSHRGDFVPRRISGIQQDFDYMVHAVGFGVRYRTPIGPLRLDLAYSINPPKFNGFPGNYSQLVQCSAANTCQASLQQISHFQFFFSIGQAF